MAKFKLGDPKPANSGRKPGVKNKTTAEIREAIQKVLADNVDGLADDLATMGEFRKWTILNSVAKYVLPTLNKNDNDTSLSGEVKITVSFEDGSTASDNNDVENDDYLSGE